MQPTDSGLYVAVSLLTAKPFGNTITYDANGNSIQSVNMYATLSLDIISRGPDARDRKEEVIAALMSVYAQQQQEANSFYIGKISTAFVNLSQIDGAAIPYRYNISVAMQYFVLIQQPTEYFDSFSTPTVVDNA